MAQYKVTIELITGYKKNDLDDPYLKPVFYTVEADNKQEAIKKAAEIDESPLSVWNSYAEEIK